ncbi:MAG: cation transporter [Bdellovibrionales bacterium]|nr:cation transporter [Bdellovibrionales bacterium]
MGFGHHHHHSDGHDHDHGHDHGYGADRAPSEDASATALKRAFVVTVGFMGIELVGGYLANSLALVSDGIHMLLDGGALALSLFAAWASKRRAPRGYTYGYQRVEILGALLNGLLVWLISGFLIFESIDRFRAPPDVKGGIVFWIATIGLISNLASLFFLHRSAKENLNVKSAYLHVITDSLGSVGAMIAGAVISLTGWQLADPIITVALALLMLWSSWSLVREAVGILLERSPAHLRLEEIEQALVALEGVRGIHDLHVWTLSSGSVALSVHLVGTAQGDQGELLHNLLTAAAHVLEERFSITHTTIQVEPEGSELTNHCGDCDPATPT